MEPELPPAVAELLAEDPDYCSSLTHEEAQFLLYGDDGKNCPFEDETQARAKWAVHRKLLMASYWGSGRRPTAWHVLEHPELPWKGPDRERSILWKAGVLEPAERDELETMWRKEFDAAQQLAPDARQKAYAAADIPRRLIREWTRERRRQQKAAQRLEAAPPVTPSISVV